MKWCGGHLPRFYLSSNSAFCILHLFSAFADRQANLLALLHLLRSSQQWSRYGLFLPGYVERWLGWNGTSSMQSVAGLRL